MSMNVEFTTKLEYTPLKQFGKANLIEALKADGASSSYCKASLINKIEAGEQQIAIGLMKNTACKIRGYVIRLNDDPEVLWGFVLFIEMRNKVYITDMYTFEKGRDNKLFNLISHMMLTTHQWNKDFEFDENSTQLSQWFVNAADAPRKHEFTITKPETANV